MKKATANIYNYLLNLYNASTCSLHAVKITLQFNSQNLTHFYKNKTFPPLTHDLSLPIPINFHAWKALYKAHFAIKLNRIRSSFSLPSLNRSSHQKSSINLNSLQLLSIVRKDKTTFPFCQLVTRKRAATHASHKPIKVPIWCQECVIWKHFTTVPLCTHKSLECCVAFWKELKQKFNFPWKCIHTT